MASDAIAMTQVAGLAISPLWSKVTWWMYRFAEFARSFFLSGPLISGAPCSRLPYNELDASLANPESSTL